MKKYFYRFIALAIIIFIPIKLLAGTPESQAVLETVCINIQSFKVPDDRRGQWEVYAPPSPSRTQAMKNNIKYFFLYDNGLFCRTLENQKCKEMSVRISPVEGKISPTHYYEIAPRWCDL